MLKPIQGYLAFLSFYYIQYRKSGIQTCDLHDKMAKTDKQTAKTLMGELLLWTERYSLLNGKDQ